MRLVRVLTCLLLGGLLTAALASSAPPVATLFGSTVDSLGNVLSDVEVLILSRQPGRPPVAVLHSDERGRFRLANLAPGVYRIAALKAGYLTTLEEVNTLLGGSIELLLRPSVPGEPSEGDSASWELRLPRRHVLRESGRTLPLPVTSVAAAPSDHDSLDLRFEQSLAVADVADLGVRGGGAHAFRGYETQLALAGDLAGRGRIAVDGLRSALTPFEGDPGEPRAPERRREQFDLSMHLRTGASADVALNAYYRRNDPFAVAHLDSGPWASHQVWGYDAAWTAQLDPASRLSLRVGYRDAATGFQVADPLVPSAPSVPTAAGNQLLDRRMGAAGNYEMIPADRHHLRVGIRATYVDVPVRPVGGGAGEEMLLLGGWSVALDAEDAYRINRPWTLTYGLGYRHAWDGRQPTMLLPRVGGIWENDAVHVRMGVAYQTPVRTTRAVVDGTRLARLDYGDQFGYEGEVRVRLNERLQVSAEHSSLPVPVSAADEPLWSPDRPLYLSAGDATTRRAAIALTHTGTQTRARLTLSHGDARGHLSAIPLHASALGVLSDSTFRFGSAGLALRLDPSGTEFRLDYLRVEEARRLRAADRYLEDAVELRLLQDLWAVERPQARMQWMIAMRLAEVEAYGATLASLPQPLAERGRARQLSTGLTVQF